MYDKILVTLDTTPTDRRIIEHIKQLAATLHSHVVLLHVASGPSVQMYGTDAAGEAVDAGRVYLDRVLADFKAAGISATAELLYGERVEQILKWIETHGCDLIAMATHGHKALADVVFGTTANRIQHNISIPVLLLRAR